MVSAKLITLYTSCAFSGAALWAVFSVNDETATPATWADLSAACLSLDGECADGCAGFTAGLENEGYSPTDSIPCSTQGGSDDTYFTFKDAVEFAADQETYLGEGIESICGASRMLDEEAENDDIFTALRGDATEDEATEGRALSGRRRRRRRRRGGSGGLIDWGCCSTGLAFGGDDTADCTRNGGLHNGDGLSKGCKAHDYCLESGRCGSDCDRDLENAARKGGICTSGSRWPWYHWKRSTCQCQATAVKMAMGRRPNRHRNC